MSELPNDPEALRAAFATAVDRFDRANDAIAWVGDEHPANGLLRELHRIWRHAHAHDVDISDLALRYHVGPPPGIPRPADVVKARAAARTAARATVVTVTDDDIVARARRYAEAAGIRFDHIATLIADGGPRAARDWCYEHRFDGLGELIDMWPEAFADV